MIKISMKQSVIKPLWSYEPRLNDWSHKVHDITKEDCVGMLKIIKPILEKMKIEDKEIRATKRWHYSTPEMLEKLESAKQMIKVFTSLKSVLNEDTITLDFNF